MSKTQELAIALLAAHEATVAAATTEAAALAAYRAEIAKVCSPTAYAAEMAVHAAKAKLESAFFVAVAAAALAA